MKIIKVKTHKRAVMFFNNGMSQMKCIKPVQSPSESCNDTGMADPRA